MRFGVGGSILRRGAALIGGVGRPAPNGALFMAISVSRDQPIKLGVWDKARHARIRVKSNDR